MTAGANRILTTHVGSLVRPAALAAFLRAQDKGERLDERAFSDCLRRSVTEVVRRQIAIGIDLMNDGEFGKTISWSRYIVERMNGFEQRDARPDDPAMPKAVLGKDHRDFPEFYAEYDATQGFSRMRGWTVTGPIRYRGLDALHRDIA